MKVGAISLGCDKNRVDTERILGYVVQAGHEIVNRLEDAEIVIVNTCSFLQSAVKESLDAIFEARANENVAHVIVTGCLPMRYLTELTANDGLSEADAFLDPTAYHRIGEVIERVQKGERVVITKDSTEITPSPPEHTRWNAWSSLPEKTRKSGRTT